MKNSHQLLEYYYERFIDENIFYDYCNWVAMMDFCDVEGQ